jgi:NTP pyrophosphatase (non-canonical NTP hydrolase)
MSDLDVKIQDVADYWNYKMPMMAMEELAEAIQAISKVERARHVFNREALEDGVEVADASYQKIDKRKDELKDEIRDIYISMRALMLYYGIDESDIMERVEEKLNKKYKED